jgi:predicted lipoprotein with Yx(FWY)xxD motif
MGFRSTELDMRAQIMRGGAVFALTLATALGVVGTMTLSTDAGAATNPTTITSTHNKAWGTILTLSNGTVVYRLTTDPKNKSVCSGTCAKVWPPVLLAAGQKKASGHGVSGLGTITRSNGAHQVTYQGIPLYRYFGDHKAGQATGNIKDKWGRWWVVNPARPHVAPTAVHASTGVTTPLSSGGSVPASGGGTAATTPPSGAEPAPTSGKGAASTASPSGGGSAPASSGGSVPTTPPSSGGSAPTSGGSPAPTSPPSSGGAAPTSGGSPAPTTVPSSGAAY